MKFYQTTWFTILTLLLFFPVGLFLMWKYQKFNKAARIIISIFFGFLILGNMFGDSDTKQVGTVVDKKEVPSTVVADDEIEEPTPEEVAAAEQSAKEEQEKTDAEEAKKAEEAAKQAEADALEVEEMLFDAELKNQVTEFGNGLGLIGELFILLSSNPLAGQSEEFEYASGEIENMLNRMMDSANELDAPSTREQAKSDYIEIIERTQQASEAGVNGVKALDAELITEGGILMSEVNQMLEDFLATHY
ncbi:hypothetical protein [Exiguobacterium sp. ZOR0005]|uniref:hypothetical protein n=1 Tax=Exiguobacterium sp. ZOR0005 TaxID=1339226 RepID=UPI00064605A5|nr:hypothetical protein [Exiguobacterium sp. ZOR0005]